MRRRSASSSGRSSTGWADAAGHFDPGRHFDPARLGGPSGAVPRGAVPRGRRTALHRAAGALFHDRQRRPGAAVGPERRAMIANDGQAIGRSAARPVRGSVPRLGRTGATAHAGGWRASGAAEACCRRRSARLVRRRLAGRARPRAHAGTRAPTRVLRNMAAVPGRAACAPARGADSLVIDHGTADGPPLPCRMSADATAGIAPRLTSRGVGRIARRASPKIPGIPRRSVARHLSFRRGRPRRSVADPATADPAGHRQVLPSPLAHGPVV